MYNYLDKMHPLLYCGLYVLTMCMLNMYTFLRDTNSEHVLSTGSFKSIKESVELATKEKDPNLDWYIAMSDSIIATIRSANVQCTKLQAENLAKVIMISIRSIV